LGSGVIEVADFEQVSDFEEAQLWTDLARVLEVLFTEGSERLVERVLAEEGGPRRWQELRSLLDTILSLEILESGATGSAPARVRERVEERNRLFKRWVSDVAAAAGGGRTSGRARVVSHAR
jgi:hypothetical protein